MQHVLRVSRLEQEDEFVLVHCSSAGSQPLDLNLLATEGSAPFYASLTQRSVGQLRDAKHCDASEWVAVLGWIFLQKTPEIDIKNLPQLELIATSVDEGSIILTVRRKISKIAHRLGSITLKHDESRDIELFDWTSTAAQAQASAMSRVRELEVELLSKTTIISTLQTQLDEFVTAKSDSDRQMLEKFQVLLNSKKLKIRDQQRLLATAKVDEAVAEQVQQTRQAPSTRTRPQRGKRKAVEPSPPVEHDQNKESEPAGANNTTNAVEDEEETASERATETPDRSDEETSDEEAFQVQAPSTTNQPSSSSGPKKDSRVRPDEPMKLPPRRQLPTRQADTRGAPSQAASETMADDEETDDEL